MLVCTIRASCRSPCAHDVANLQVDRAHYSTRCSARCSDSSQRIKLWGLESRSPATQSDQRIYSLKNMHCIDWQVVHFMVIVNWTFIGFSQSCEMPCSSCSSTPHPTSGQSMLSKKSFNVTPHCQAMTCSTYDLWPANLWPATWWPLSTCLWHPPSLAATNVWVALVTVAHRKYSDINTLSSSTRSSNSIQMPIQLHIKRIEFLQSFRQSVTAGKAQFQEKTWQNISICHPKKREYWQLSNVYSLKTLVYTFIMQFMIIIVSCDWWQLTVMRSPKIGQSQWKMATYKSS